jgi:cytochrome c5
MTFEHAPDAVEKKMESHPSKLVVWIGIGTVALIVAIIMLAQFAVGMWGGRSLENDPAMKPEALAARIAPVAKLQLQGTAEVAPAPQGAKVAAVAAAPAAAGKPDGKKTYDTACMACHATGAANAPKLGDKAAWAPRIKTGAATLYASALKGKGAMPPKGGNAALPDADVKAAVDYLVAGSK